MLSTSSRHSAAQSPSLNGMQKHRDITLSRIVSFLAEGHQFADVGLAATLTEVRDSKAVSLTVYSVPDGKRIPFSEAIKGAFVPAKVGDALGPVWSTHWYKVAIVIPSSFAGKRVELLFDPGCEALVWSSGGEPLMGITGAHNGDRHVDFCLTRKAKADERFNLYIEVSCNGMFGAGIGGNGSIQPPDEKRMYQLETAEIIVRNELAWDVQRDVEVLVGMIKELPKDSQASNDALFTANKIVNLFRYDDPSSLQKCKEVSADFFAKRTSTGYPQHVMTAMGNCHIDTAWLWPYDETKRKCARSWATQCGLIEEYPEYTFTASQAQQFEWTEQLYPELFTRIQKHAKAGQFIPVGGTWVEMDCNIPSGEAFCRQFLYGQRYFESRFGERSRVFWLPDTFGYSAQLPQIIHEADLKYFFTQKLSWNNINKFPHTTFMWTGIDNTSVLTHFSPADTYTAQASVHDVVFSVQNNKDKMYTNQSLLAYGNGDGGGGPLIPMLERIRRMSRVGGFPAVINHGTPNSFYEELEKNSKDLVEWKGELYLEFHRGTYTTHAKVKKNNRSTELLLRNIEILSSLCIATNVDRYKNPKDELDRLWKLVLLNQFHDVLPGSSIGDVYLDALQFYEDVTKSGSQLMETAFHNLISSAGKTSSGASTSCPIFNPTSWTRNAEVIETDLASGVKSTAFRQVSACGTKGLQLVESIPAYALRSCSFEDSANSFVPVTVEEEGDTIVVTNVALKVVLNRHGRILSLFDREEGRECIAPGYHANVFRLYEDVPLFWDAWDVEVYHLEKGWDTPVGKLNIIETGPLRVVLKVTHPLTANSSLTQKIILRASSKSVEFENHAVWKENRRILKVEFPVNVSNDYATYETQFGFIRRPTHYNNSWDLARFEVCAHKFVDYSECGYGVALLNDCKYGFSVHNDVIRMSLLRAPKAPDANCDMGEHTFRYALYPHKGGFTESDVVQAGYEYNVPLLVGSPTSSAITPSQYFKVDQKNIVLDTIKVAEDASGKDIIVRMYESSGGRGVVKLTTTLPVRSCHYCNILEDVKASVPKDDAGALVIPFTPFKLISLKFVFA
ncbi:hypothetical protein PhCBS80983_g03399 [Powellomyces hirtus]|uniref:Alpha-mannosidase n=1 Tax=Powellomyces hirtus TaxID=109895 RepID=A0A507E3W6_9FUNG|nr:hypothetical protein PhCBS80983_g03399 [Powellomyces hirtus]